MGHSIAYRYSVALRIARGRMTPAGWDIRSVGQRHGNGLPTAANLERYVRDYNASLAPEGVNSHLGAGARAYAADITDTLNQRVVASWQAPAFDARGLL